MYGRRVTHPGPASPTCSQLHSGLGEMGGYRKERGSGGPTGLWRCHSCTLLVTRVRDRMEGKPQCPCSRCPSAQPHLRPCALGPPAPWPPPASTGCGHWQTGYGFKCVRGCAGPFFFLASHFLLHPGLCLSSGARGTCVGLPDRGEGGGAPSLLCCCVDVKGLSLVLRGRRMGPGAVVRPSTGVGGGQDRRIMYIQTFFFASFG